MRDNWKRIKISNLCDLIVDCVNKTAPVVSFPTPYKMIRTSNIKNGRIDLHGCRFVDKGTFEKWTRRAKVLQGDVLITREAPMGEVGYVNYTDETFLGQRVVQYRANPHKLDSRFLLYSFLSPDLQFQFGRFNNGGSTVSHICVPDCFEFEINTPPLPIQKKVASVLSSIDDKIELNNRINAELEQMAKTLYDYWFVQFDFPNEDGKPYKSSGGKMVYNKVLKREIPEGWAVNNLFDACKVQYGFPFSTEYFNEQGYGLPVIRIRDILDNTISNYSTQTSVDAKYLIEKGDILIGMDGNFHINYWSRDSCYLNQRVVKLSKTTLPSIYLKSQIEPFIWAREKSVSRTTVGHLSDKDLKAIHILVPSEDVLSKISILYDETLNKIIANLQQNQQLASLRDWLLPMLMNGQVTVGEVLDHSEENSEEQVDTVGQEGTQMHLFA